MCCVSIQLKLILFIIYSNNEFCKSISKQLVLKSKNIAYRL